jgi:hypothetical protein
MAWSGPTTCACGCGQPIEQARKAGRPKLYASNACKMRARRKRGFIDRYHGRDYIIVPRASRRVDTK